MCSTKMSDEMMKKSFRCSTLYQHVIDKAKQMYKLNTDTDAILMGLRCLRDKIASKLQLPEDDEYSSSFSPASDRKVVDFADKTQRDWLKEWKEHNL